MSPSAADAQEPDRFDRRRSRLLYWWPNPTMEDSAGTGRQMLRTIVLWLVAVIVVIVLIGLLLAL